MPNWPWPMKESINLIDGMLGHVNKYVSKSWTCEICDMKSSNVLTLIALNSSNGWTQIVQVTVFRQIR